MRLDAAGYSLHCLEQACLIVQSCQGDDELMTKALTRLVQQRLFKVLVEFSRPLETADLARIATTISDLGRLVVSQRRRSADVEQRLERQHGAATAEVGALERKGGLSPDSARAMRDLLLGIDLL
ncbi:MAG: phage protein Gp27 family protein, partial [Candidatus Binataceae bacterium]